MCARLYIHTYTCICMCVCILFRSLTDLATYAHVNSLMSTRQSAAPSRLRHLIVPYVMSTTAEAQSLITRNQEAIINMSFDVSNPSEVRSDDIYDIYDIYVCAYVRMCVCAYVRMCVCAYVRMCVCAYECLVVQPI